MGAEGGHGFLVNFQTTDMHFSGYPHTVARRAKWLPKAFPEPLRQTGAATVYAARRAVGDRRCHRSLHYLDWAAP